MKKQILVLAVLLLSAPANAHGDDIVAEIDYQQPLVVSHPGIGSCEFAYDGKRFYVIHDESITKVKHYDVDKTLRGISREQLLSFLDGGYLYINQFDNGDFTIQAKCRLRGGILGMIIVMVIASATAAMIDDGPPPYADAIKVPPVPQVPKKMAVIGSGNVATIALMPGKALPKKVEQKMPPVKKPVEVKPIKVGILDNECVTLAPRPFPLPHVPHMRGLHVPKPPIILGKTYHV